MTDLLALNRDALLDDAVNDLVPPAPTPTARPAPPAVTRQVVLNNPAAKALADAGLPVEVAQRWSAAIVADQRVQVRVPTGGPGSTAARPSLLEVEAPCHVTILSGVCVWQMRASEQRPLSRAYKGWEEKGYADPGADKGEDEAGGAGGEVGGGAASGGGWSGGSVAQKGRALYGEVLQGAATKAKLKPKSASLVGLNALPCHLMLFIVHKPLFP
jgi:hypothetical protein